jgi:hypothetical protein
MRLPWLASEERRVYEAVLGHPLADNQQVIIRVLEAGVEPTEITRRASMTRAAEIARQGRAATKARGITLDQAGAAIDQSIAEVRQSPR